MARKGNQQKNGLDRNASNHKNGCPDPVSVLSKKKGRGNANDTNVVNVEEFCSSNQSSIPLSEGLNEANHVAGDKKSKKKPGNVLKSEKQSTAETQGSEHTGPSSSTSGDCNGNMPTLEDYGFKQEQWASPNGFKRPKRNPRRWLNGLDAGGLNGRFKLPDHALISYLRTYVLSASKAFAEWLEQHKPLFDTVMTKILRSRDYIRKKIEHAYPIVLRWLTHFANIVLLLSMVWLDCTLRGMDSVLRMGTTSFFTVIWCSIFSLVASIGMLKFFAVVAIAALIGLFMGFTISMFLLGFSGIVFLWFYGSFWTTTLVILFGGLAFTFSHERIALLVTTLYSVYCVWTSVGWIGFVLALNLSFISSDALVFFLRNNINEQRRSNSAPEQTAGMHGHGPFTNDPANSSPETGTNVPAERSAGVPSTSGSDSDITSEDEVIRLLNSVDHYSALGLSRFEEVDVSILKREYRKKAMLVHPDKNMGNEKAAEAFKKLQNAYEVLLDTFKRKAYDDELRREDLLNYFRRFQNISQQDRGHGFFSSTFGRTETDFEDPLGESRRIACRKCNGFHMWFYTKKSKSRARWCQDCKDFHPAKDGDGWVEQSSQPLLFGIFQKVDAPCAFVCADSKVYDATEWYSCQGMRCPVNTHKPSFHVNTSVMSKHSNGKGASSGQKGGGGMPPPNMDETMTEEEFMEWLQNAVQAGMFDNFSSATSDGSSFPGNSSKSGGAGSNTSGSKKKKKGKKQW